MGAEELAEEVFLAAVAQGHKMVALRLAVEMLMAAVAVVHLLLQAALGRKASFVLRSTPNDYFTH